MHAPPIIKAIDQGFIETDDRDAFSIYTRQLGAIDLEEVDSVTVCPVLLQECLQKAREYRITVIGDSVFATTIADRHGQPVALDWRAVGDGELEYREAELPGTLEQRCRATVKAFGLEFAALDVVELANGELVFLEINSNGQWAWVEMQTGQPMRRAMTRLLARQPNGQR